MEMYSWVGAVALEFLLAILAGAPVMRGLFRLVDWQARHEALRREAAEAEESGPELIGLKLARAGKELSGGRWLGLLEHAVTYACMVASFPAGITVTMAVKGFGRYPKLRTPGTAKGEQLIIGTLASLLWALLRAGLALLFRVCLKIGWTDSPHPGVRPSFEDVRCSRGIWPYGKYSLGSYPDDADISISSPMGWKHPFRWCSRAVG